VDIVVLQGEREKATDNRVLGRFRLENIRPAPRGEPQIEVTFDVDANGILNVSARDKDTGAQQAITITESSNLDRSEVERMLAEAERNRETDMRARELIDARNELDSLAYRVERRLGDLGEAAPAHEKARAEMLVGDARQAIKEDAPLDRVRSLTDRTTRRVPGPHGAHSRAATQWRDWSWAERVRFRGVWSGSTGRR
jgi:molecular chaperone DnaK